MSKKNLIITMVLAVVIAGFFIFKNIRNTGTKIPETVQPPAKAQPAPQQSELNILKNAALSRNIPAGDTKIIKELKDLSSQLKSEPNYLQGWLQLGILRKYLRDYEGASLAWQYASLIRPNDYIAFSNLGDLYHYYLRDFPKAEKYLRRAVDVKPDYVAGYKNLFDLYTLSYPPDRRTGKEKAETILLEGIKKNSSDHYLQGILDSYRAGNI